VAEKRLSRKDMRQPDQFMFVSVQIMEWGKTHVRSLLYGLIGVLSLIVLMVGWSAWQRHRTQQAELALYEAKKLMSTRSTERPQALERLQKLVNDYGGTTPAASAYWQLGHLYFENGDYKAALTAYQQAQQRFSKTAQPLMMALITLDIAYAQEASGACTPDAIASFEAVLQFPAHWLRGESYLGVGRCHETTGAPHKALAVYERALSDTNLNDTARQPISERRAFLQLPDKG